MKQQKSWVAVGKLLFDIFVRFMCYLLVFKLYMHFVHPRIVWRRQQEKFQRQRERLRDQIEDDQRPENVSEGQGRGVFQNPAAAEDTANERVKGAELNFSNNNENDQDEEENFIKETTALLKSLASKKPYLSYSKNLLKTQKTVYTNLHTKYTKGHSHH